MDDHGNIKMMLQLRRWFGLDWMVYRKTPMEKKFSKDSQFNQPKSRTAGPAS